MHKFAERTSKKKIMTQKEKKFLHSHEALFRYLAKLTEHFLHLSHVTQRANGNTTFLNKRAKSAAGGIELTKTLQNVNSNILKGDKIGPDCRR